jgi:ferric-dicitrate binding protein FerR (iron transport regulator)
MEKKILHRYFEGVATLEEEKAVEKWLAAAPGNEKIMLAERKLHDIITVAGPGDNEQMLILASSTEKKRNTVRELLKAAAVAIIVISGTLAWQYFISDRGNVNMQTINIPAGQRVKLTLPDGSTVWLNARTQLRYPVNFNSRVREMELAGEGFFEVTADARRPFIVKTPNGRVTALGTKFNVEDYSDTGVFETTLMSGKVTVASNREPEKELTLKPGLKAILTDKGLNMESVADFDRYRWIEGLICFKEENFMDVMKEFEKYYGVTIKVNTPALNNYVLTGKFRHTDGVDYALRVLQRDVRFKYMRNDEEQIIYIE